MINKRNTKNCAGFALVLTFSITSLLVVMAIALFILSAAIEKRQVEGNHHKIARANAKIALGKSIELLQSTMGLDQMVCAEANILGESVSHPHWLGVWKTTQTFGDKEWYVVGKLNEEQTDTAPYSHKHSYSDTRDANWRDIQHRCWLVSGSKNTSHLSNLSETESVVLLGEGSLAHIKGSDLYNKNSVSVPLVDICNSNSTNGRYAFWIANNNLKANVVAKGNYGYSNPNPATIESIDDSMPMKKIHDLTEEEKEKMVTLKSLDLLGLDVKTSLRRQFHSLTSSSYGMHINTMYGGFKKDLTPILFGDSAKKEIRLTILENSDGSSFLSSSNYNFSSDLPIINSTRKSLLGPRFNHLRSWGLMKYDTGLFTKHINADFAISKSELSARSEKDWIRSVSDGVCIHPNYQSIATQGITPVMSSVSWHFSFSYTGKGIDSATDPDGSTMLRFHMMPKVKLWNPYNVELSIPNLIVMMPNILTRDDGGLMRFEFYLEDEYVEKTLKVKHPCLENWQKTNVSGESLYKFSIGGGVVPQTKQLGFLLESVKMLPGECLVFSPKIEKEEAINSEGLSFLKVYNVGSVADNKLSAHAPFGESSFIHEVKDISNMRVGSNSVGKNLSTLSAINFLRDIDFSRSFRYKFDGIVKDTMTFSLKACNSDGKVPADSILEVDAYNYPTLQLINCADGGTQSGSWHASNFFLDPLKSNFLMENTEHSGAIFFPQTFQIGAKLISLNEQFYEADENYSFRTRYSQGLKPESMLFNYSPIAHGNIRPSMVTRAPHHFNTRWWGSRAMGNWLLTHASPSPSESTERPFKKIEYGSGEYRKPVYAMSPLHEWGTYRGESNAIMFDLPSRDYGCLAITELGNASVSPYSWHPTYAVGNSFVDLSTSTDLTSNPLFEDVYNGRELEVSSSFDFYSGGVESATKSWSELIEWGPETGKGISNDSLLFIGSNPVETSLAGINLNSKDEILCYDQSFELNHSLYDHFFFSGMPLSHNGEKSFEWQKEKELDNSNHQSNRTLPDKLVESHQQQVNKDESLRGLTHGFLKNGFFLECKNQFNINSTSVSAWKTILSGLQMSDSDHPVHRTRSHFKSEKTEELNESQTGGLLGSRVLSDEEVCRLAECIVEQVKLRGPFLSISDFVNRRLSTDIRVSQMSALDKAIKNSGINDHFDNGKTKYDFTLGVKSGGRAYNVHPEFQPDYTNVLADSKSVNLPSYITQRDLLKHLDPYISARGETFTIRCYGESVVNDETKAKAYLEVVVIRTPIKLAEELTEKNLGKHIDGQLQIQPVSGEYLHSAEEKKNLGRGFKIISKKWLIKSEI